MVGRGAGYRTYIIANSTVVLLFVQVQLKRVAVKIVPVFKSMILLFKQWEKQQTE